MTRPTVYFAITNHGFGHAVRTACIAAEIQRQNPDILIIMATTAPRWLLECYIPGDFIYRPRALDIGVIQSDSFQMDLNSTLIKLKEIIQNKDKIIRAEVEFITQNQVDLVFADIPPLAIEIAHQAHIPCWGSSNFGWDLIYQAWGSEFLEVVDWINYYYQQCDRLFRVPLHDSMKNFPIQEDVGLTGGKPHYDLSQLRDQFNIINPKEKTVMLTFGGLNLEAIPYDVINQFNDHQFITFDRLAPDLPNLIKITDNKYRPVDFMPLCDRVICKPGYTTYAEAMILDIPLATLSRSGFAESSIIMNSMADHSYHQLINNEAFFAGNWSFLNEPVNPPRSGKTLPKNGTETIAQEIINYLRETS